MSEIRRRDKEDDDETKLKEEEDVGRGRRSDAPSREEDARVNKGVRVDRMVG